MLRQIPHLQNKSRAIVEDDTDLFAVDFAGVPVEVYKAHAMISLISDVGFPSFFLFRVLFGQTIFEKNLRDRIVGYVPTVFMLYYCFEASCARILLFVDASTASKLLLMLISMISR